MKGKLHSVLEMQARNDLISHELHRSCNRQAGIIRRRFQGLIGGAKLSSSQKYFAGKTKMPRTLAGSA
jgi:hypothetical protein